MRIFQNGNSFCSLPTFFHEGGSSLSRLSTPKEELILVFEGMRPHSKNGSECLRKDCTQKNAVSFDKLYSADRFVL